MESAGWGPSGPRKRRRWDYGEVDTFSEATRDIAVSMAKVKKTVHDREDLALRIPRSRGLIRVRSMPDLEMAKLCPEVGTPSDFAKPGGFRRRFVAKNTARGAAAAETVMDTDFLDKVDSSRVMENQPINHGVIEEMVMTDHEPVHEVKALEDLGLDPVEVLRAVQCEGKGVNDVPMDVEVMAKGGAEFGWAGAAEVAPPKALKVAIAPFNVKKASMRSMPDLQAATHQPVGTYELHPTQQQQQWRQQQNASAAVVAMDTETASPSSGNGDAFAAAFASPSANRSSSSAAATPTLAKGTNNAGAEAGAATHVMDGAVPAGKATKGRRELPRHAVEVLKAWMMTDEHINHPYPTKEEKKKLIAAAGIDRTQLNNWFINARRRCWKQMLKEKYGATADPESAPASSANVEAQTQSGAGSGSGPTHSMPQQPQPPQPPQPPRQQQPPSRFQERPSAEFSEDTDAFLDTLMSNDWDNIPESMLMPPSTLDADDPLLDPLVDIGIPINGADMPMGLNPWEPVIAARDQENFRAAQLNQAQRMKQYDR